MVGIDDVARRAEVSTATVSRALSGRGRVSEKTRDRVRAAADELGYVVSAAASSLATGRTSNIGVLVPLTDMWFFSTVLSGIASHLSPRGFDIALYHLSDREAQRRHVLETSLRRGRIDGLIALSVKLEPAELDDLLASPLPVIGLGARTDAFPTLRIDDVEVARRATRHLLELGHRRIAHVGQSTPEDDFDIPTSRRRGFEAALADAGVRPAAFVTGADFTIEAGYRAGRTLLEADEPPTAVFAASDELAFGVIFAARERGIRVPEDLSVVGVDGHPHAEFFGLTTVAQFPSEQGRLAGAAILELIETGTAPETTLPFELVVRGSTGPPA
jgi:LacI family repressor for deo operon, udp, cdd, tsx, nupC, and nupG